METLRDARVGLLGPHGAPYPPLAAEGNDGTGRETPSARTLTLATGIARRDAGEMAAMRIWVARPEPGATRTGDRLVALGHDALVAPVLVIAPTQALPPAGPFDALIATSANAFGNPSRWRYLVDCPVFAVGGRTADLARAAGFGTIHVAAGDALALAGLVRASMPPGAALLHAAGADRKSEPAVSLVEAGYRLTSFVAYAARPTAGLPARVASALGDGSLDAALHYSRRSAAAARDLTVAAGYGGAFAALRHYCLSRDVAGPLAEAGIAVHFIARSAGEDGLLAGLASGF